MAKRGHRRGYEVAVLISLEKFHAFIWGVYSESVKPERQIHGADEYNFYESIIAALRPRIRQGVKGVVVATVDKKDYEGLMRHVSRHHGWLLKDSLNRVSFRHISEQAASPEQVRALVKSQSFREKISEVYQLDVQQAMDILEKRLSSPEGIEKLLFTLNEVEDVVYGDGGNSEYIMVTEAFMSRHRQRVLRLLQIATNKNLMTRIVEDDSPAGVRVKQFGGLVCMLKA